MDLNDIDVGLPVPGATVDELAVEIKSLKEILKVVLLKAHKENGDLKAGAVVELGDNLVDADQIMDSAITEAKLADNSVTGAKIKDGEITGAKMVPGFITSTMFSSACIPPTAFQLGSVPLNALIGQIGSTQIADGCVTTIKLADGAVTDDKINGVSYGKLTGTATVGQVLTYSESGWVPAAAVPPPTYGLAVLAQESNTGGGNAITPDVWNKRMFSVPQYTADFVSVNYGEMAFEPGTYFLFVRAPAHEVKAHQIRLVKEVTETSTRSPIAYGSAAHAFSNTVYHVQTDSVLIYLLTVSSSDAAECTYSIEHYFEAVAESDDFGAAMPGSSGNAWIHTSGFIFKLA